MKERPILFRAPMVRAILEGRKTQTRRIAKNVPPTPKGFEAARLRWCHWTNRWQWIDDKEGCLCVEDGEPPRYGMPGDRLWVRETWAQRECPQHDMGQPPGTLCLCLKAGTLYAADGRPPYGGLSVQRWKPSIHMPRWASRLTLEVTEVRVERLQDVSSADCEAEGVRPASEGDATDWRGEEDGWHRTFRQLWDSINAARGFGWESNPWVWAISFRRVEAQERAA